MQANGVAVTRNLSHSMKFGITVNAHAGADIRSTDVNGKHTPEQTVIHLSRYAGAIDMELVSYLFCVNNYLLHRYICT